VCQRRNVGVAQSNRSQDLDRLGDVLSFIPNSGGEFNEEREL
jgi:hypothetical protein